MCTQSCVLSHEWKDRPEASARLSPVRSGAVGEGCAQAEVRRDVAAVDFVEWFDDEAAVHVKIVRAVGRDARSHVR